MRPAERFVTISLIPRNTSCKDEFVTMPLAKVDHALDCSIGGCGQPYLGKQLPGSPQHAAVQAAQKLLTSVPKHMLHEDPRAAPMILEECRLSLASKAELLLLRLPLEEPAVVLLQLSSWTQAQVHRPHSAA